MLCLWVIRFLKHNFSPTSVEKEVPRDERESIQQSVLQIKDDFDNALYDKCVESINKLLQDDILEGTRRCLIYRRAMCYWRLKKYEDVEKDLFQVIEMSSKNGG